MIVLSARDEAGLRASVTRLLAFIERQATMAPNRAVRQRWEERLRTILAELLQVDAAEIERGVCLEDYGVAPVFYAQLAERLARFDVELTPDVFLDLKTPALIAEHLSRTADNSGRDTDHGLDLFDLAYTLQVGREAMPERLGLIAHSIDEVKQKLGHFLNASPCDGLFLDRADRHQETLALFADDEEMAGVVDAWFGRHRYAKLLALWVKGFALDWFRFHAASGLHPRRIGLPTYPFAKDRYWHPALHKERQPAPPQAEAPQTAAERMREERSAAAGNEMDHANPEPRTKAELLLRQLVAMQLGQPIERLEAGHGYLEVGLDSRGLVALVQAVSHLLQEDFSPGLLFEHTTIGAFADYLAEHHGDRLRDLVPTRQPREEAEAVPAFKETFEFFDLTPDVDLSTLAEKGREYCALDWEDVKAKYPGIPPIFLKTFCYNTAYFWSLITKGYGFEDKDAKIVPNDGSWTLGAVIDTGMGHQPVQYKSEDQNKE
jgi:acyl carrier protein